MSKSSIKQILHKNTSDTIIDILSSVNGITIESNLGKVMNDRGVTQRRLALLTGLRQATISDLVNGKNIQINKSHLIAIMIVLRVTDITELFNIKFTQEVTEQFQQEAKEWKETKQVPESVLRMALHSINK